MNLEQNNIMNKLGHSSNLSGTHRMGWPHANVAFLSASAFIITDRLVLPTQDFSENKDHQTQMTKVHLYTEEFHPTLL